MEEKKESKVDEKKEVKEEKKDSHKDESGKKGNKSHKGNKPGKKDDKRGGSKEDRKARNDVTWYTKYPALVTAASSIIFNQPYGYSPRPVDITSTSDYQFSAGSIPGIVGYKYLPLYVEDASEQSAVNIATKNLYTYIRHANSGAANYESSDLMQYLITVCGLITAVEQIKRDLRLVPTFNPLNRYVFSAALRAVGYSEANIAVMRQTQAINVANINQVVAQLNTFKVPKDFSLLDRHVWLSSNIWRDDDLNKCSYYVFYTNALPHYDWANRKVEVKDLGTLDLPGKISAIQTEINNLLAYEDIGIMLGDILKAYKQEGCRVISPMQLGEVCDAGYSEEALSQFTNAFIFGVNKFDYDIIQNSVNSQLLEMASAGNTNGHLKITLPNLSSTSTNITKINFNPILTIDSNEPDSASVIVGTRFMIAGELTVTGNKLVYDSNRYPTEIILEARAWYYTLDMKNNNTTLNAKEFHSINLAVFQSGSSTSGDDLLEVAAQLKACAALDKVSYNPNLYFILNDVENSDVEKEDNVACKYMGKNTITITSDWLDRLNKGCKQSLYSLPMFKLLESN